MEQQLPSLFGSDAWEFLYLLHMSILVASPTPQSKAAAAGDASPKQPHWKRVRYLSITQYVEPRTKPSNTGCVLRKLYARLHGLQRGSLDCRIESYHTYAYHYVPRTRPSSSKRCSRSCSEHVYQVRYSSFKVCGVSDSS